MNVVMDTNVVVSGLLFGGVPGRILSAWYNRAFVLVISSEIINEYHRVGQILARGQPALLHDVEALLALVTRYASMVNPPPMVGPVSEDPDDDKFFAAALAGNARVIVSGDKHLLRVSGWNAIDVVKPRQFVERYLMIAD